MHSQSLHERIQYLEQQLRQLLMRHKEQQQALQQLQAENAQLRQSTSGTATVAPSGVHEAAAHTVVHELQQVAGWESKLDACIQELDKSIAYLEQQASWKN